MSVTMPTLIFFRPPSVAAGSRRRSRRLLVVVTACGDDVPMHSARTAMSRSRSNFAFTESIPP